VGRRANAALALVWKRRISYEIPICGGGAWFTRAGYEVQYWNDFVVPIGDETRPTSTVFHGFFAAIGLQR